MFVKVAKLRPHTFAWDWRKDQRILLIGAWFFAIGFDFGLEKSDWYKHFNGMCIVCKKPLKPNTRLQRKFFHGECRKEGRRLMTARRKAEQFTSNQSEPQINFYDPLFRKVDPF